MANKRELKRAIKAACGNMAGECIITREKYFRKAYGKLIKDFKEGMNDIVKQMNEALPAKQKELNKAKAAK